MKKAVLTCGVLAALLFLGACSTIDMFTYEDENIYAELEMNNPAQVTLMVDNRGNGELTLDRERVFYISGGRRSLLKGIDVTAAETQASPLRIPPGTRQSQSFALEEAISPGSGKLKITDWVPEDNAGDHFNFVYSAAGAEYPLAFPDSKERPLVGTVKVSLDIAMPFRYSITERRRRIYDLAMAQAKDAFGERGRELRLVNIHYDSVSKGLSEKTFLTAGVIAVETGN
jgi:hypothetical protein